MGMKSKRVWSVASAGTEEGRMQRGAWPPAPGLEDQVPLGMTFESHLKRNYVEKKG